MTLHLVPSDTAQPAAAAFLRGSSPADWLAEISRWGIPVSQLTCYALPESAASRRPAGLLVVPQNPDIFKRLDGLDLYAAAERGKLFIPQYSALFPRVDASEWHRLLAWEVQIFHPNLGFLGFYKEDALDLSKLIELPLERKMDWSKARPGLPPPPPFTRVEVPRPPIREVFKNIEKDMGSGHTPTGEKRDSGEKASEDLKTKLEKMLDNLDAQRRAEMERLLNLFQQNKGDALRYAPPLNDPYAGRGTAPPSGFLSEQIPDFSLENIGGGKASSSWELQHELFEHLRKLYLETANEAAARGDFRIAAYIYAHLLGDFRAAANCLEQGKYYREAAVLYREHLKNLPAAAECLERGGLWAEAAEIQEELQSFEKAGDLCLRMEQPERAEALFQKTLNLALQKQDYLDAARLAELKLKQPAVAQQHLLEGWKTQKQSESCLKKYLEITLRLEPEQLAERVKSAFTENTRPHQRSHFLQGLLHLNALKTNPETRAASNEIAYQIISEEALKGKEGNLRWLNQFRTDDRLLESDTNRYTHRQNKLPAQRKSGELLTQLSPHIQWWTAAYMSDQWIALGRQSYVPSLARGNWRGHVEYHSWQQPMDGSTRFGIINAPGITHRILLQPNNPSVLHWKELLKSEVFGTTLDIGAPQWLPAKSQERLTITRHSEVVGLELGPIGLTVKYYNFEGILQDSNPCQGEGLAEIIAGGTQPLGKFSFYNQDFYSHIGNHLLKIRPNGTTYALEMPEPIRFVRHWAVGSADEHLFMVVGESGQCWLLNLPRKLPEGQISFSLANLVYSGEGEQYLEGRFVLPNRFVLVGEDHLVVLDIEDSNQITVKKIPIHSPVVALMPADNRRYFAVLHQSGELRLY